MKKKEKVKLEKISVKSFITTLSDKELKKANGGTGSNVERTMPIWCTTGDNDDT